MMKKKIKTGKPFRPSKKYLKEQMLGWVDERLQCPQYRPRNKPHQSHFRASNENGESFEHIFCEIVKWEYNRGRNRQDAIGKVLNRIRNIEFKRERPEVNNLCANMLWSINSEKGRLKLVKDDMTLVMSGLVDGQIAYILLVESVNNTTILDKRTTYSGAKVNKTWGSFGSNFRLLYINRPLVTKYATTAFANELLAKDEEFEQIFGFSFRNYLGLPSDQRCLYYNKGESVDTKPHLSAGHTCIVLNKTAWNRNIKRAAKKLCDNQQTDLQIGSDVLTIKNESGQYWIKSSIDDTKTKFRPLDLSLAI